MPPPTALCVKIFHWNVLKNEMEIPVFRTKVAFENTLIRASNVSTNDRLIPRSLFPDSVIRQSCS